MKSTKHFHQNDEEEQLYAGYDSEGHWKVGKKEDWEEEGEDQGKAQRGRSSSGSHK